MPARSSMFPRKRSSAMSTYAGPSMHVHLYMLLLPFPLLRIGHVHAQSRYVNPTNACHPTHPALFLAGSKVPNGSGSAGSAVSHACSSATLAAVTCLWSGWCPTVLPRAVTSTQPMALFLAGSKVPNGSGSADQVGTRWA